MPLTKIYYEEEKAQAAKLKEAAEQCREEARVASKYQDFSGVWEGASGRAMQTKIIEWITEQNAIAAELETIADTIIRTVERIQTADETAAQGGGGSR